MSMWRPPRTTNERALRAIRSMQNGSMDGSVVSAKPVHPIRYDFSEITEPEGEIADPNDPTNDNPLEPWTDVFTLKTDRSYVHTLSKSPYIQKKMNEKGDHPGNRSTIHIYWNNVYQKDLSYTLKGNTIFINDTSLSLKKGDVLSIKYWFIEGGNPRDPDEPINMVIPLDVWVSGYSSNFRGVLFQNGLIVPPTRGVNGGRTVFKGYLFSTLFFGKGTSIRYKYRLPEGIDLSSIDPDECEFSLTFIARDQFKTVIDDKVFLENFAMDYRTELLSDECHGIWSFYIGPQLPDGPDGGEIYPPAPSPYGVGGITFAEGEDGERIFKSLRSISNDPTAVDKGLLASTHPFDALTFEGNDGCRNCHCCWNTSFWEGMEICQDDTVRSIQHRINSGWYLDFGVTLYITSK